MTPDPIITLKNVSLQFASHSGLLTILKNINLTIDAGQSVGIIGPSGSGKSSLMNLMTGLEAPTTGEIWVKGLDFAQASEDRLAHFRRDHIGIIMQAFHLIPSMTALENVAIPLELAGQKDAYTRAAIELETVGLSHRLDHYPTQLSGGEQQRTALARALAGLPAIIFGDEPTGNLDSKTGATIIDLIFERAKNSTLILITHDAALADRCDRVISIHDGQIIDDTGDTRLIETADTPDFTITKGA